GLRTINPLCLSSVAYRPSLPPRAAYSQKNTSLELLNVHRDLQQWQECAERAGERRVEWLCSCRI
ncbi:MAG TPA: hypothetical protein VFP47_09670, partial [Pyrinomonadaceae bacterium]|nr:hypothetical protein [Pyrinomonadaceae bacterium]